jgi:hypothetical protein
MLGLWCTGMIWWQPSQHSMCLPGGARLRFHLLSVGVPGTIPGTPTGQPTYNHPAFDPGTSWWTRIHEAAFVALPEVAKSVLPPAFRPPLRLMSPDADIFTGRFTTPRYRFAFEVTDGDFNFGEWEVQISSANDNQTCRIVRWSSQGWGCLAVTSGAVMVPTRKVEQPGWLKTYCDRIPEDATSFNLVLRRKSADGKVEPSAETITFTFANPVPKPNHVEQAKLGRDTNAPR